MVTRANISFERGVSLKVKMGILKRGKIDFNDTNQIQALQKKIQLILEEPKNYYPLFIQNVIIFPHLFLFLQNQVGILS